MERWQILAIAIAVLLLLLLLFLHARRLFRRPSASAGDGRDHDAHDAAEREAEARRQQAARIGAAEKALRGDPLAAQLLLRRAGLTPAALKDVSSTRQAAEALARRLDLHQLQVMEVAAQQRDIEFDLQARTERQPVSYPTAEMQPERMTDFGQVIGVTPEQLMLDDDAFYSALAEQRLTVMQAYESRQLKRRLYILLDASGSMDRGMGNGYARHVWARGVAVNLAFKAMRGQADYLFRLFDSETHDLHEAVDEASATKLVDLVLDRGFTGGGTEIMHALKTAANDIIKRGGQVECSDILLVTDGESKLDIAQIRQMLEQAKARLHVVGIGLTQETGLKQVAASFRQF